MMYIVRFAAAQVTAFPVIRQYRFFLCPHCFTSVEHTFFRLSVSMPSGDSLPYTLPLPVTLSFPDAFPSGISDTLFRSLPNHEDNVHYDIPVSCPDIPDYRGSLVVSFLPPVLIRCRARRNVALICGNTVHTVIEQVFFLFPPGANCLPFQCHKCMTALVQPDARRHFHRLCVNRHPFP